MNVETNDRESMNMDTARDYLQKYYGYPDFREGQKKSSPVCWRVKIRSGSCRRAEANRSVIRSRRSCVRVSRWLYRL